MRVATCSFPLHRSLLGGIVLTTLGSLAAVPGTAQTAAKATVIGANNSAITYGKLPLSFEANQGQTDPSVQFLSHGQGYTLFLRPGEAVLALRSAQPAASRASAQTIPHQPSTADSSHATSLVTMQLVGANPMPAVAHEDQQITRTNYFLGSDPAKWHTDIPNYGRVRYSSVYPGIDLVYYGNQRQLEHDFVVAPGTNPAKIAIALKGAKNLHIDSVTGDLILNTGEADLRLLKPVTYQDFNGHRAEIQSSYKLLAKNHIGFAVGAYNHTQPLIIDPVLVYSTYLGGSGNTNNQGDQGNGIAVDSNGNAYVVGSTYSADFPVTGGTFQSINRAANSASTVFISKLNAAGSALVYSTYLGGSGGDFGYGVALDPAGNAYVTGATYSTDFPVTCGAYQEKDKTLTAGASTGFVTKINPLGDHLVYSTYLGGQGNLAFPPDTPAGDVAQAIAVSATGMAYVTGYTSSSNFPVTQGALQTKFQGVGLSSGATLTPNAFVSELNQTGTHLVYSTFLGGGGQYPAGDYANAIVANHAGNVFVTGTTSSPNFPVTAGALQTTLKASSNAFVTELNPAGTAEVYSTYLGGNGGDSGLAIALDNAGLAYVAGKTSSSDFPTTDGVVEGANLTYLQNFVAYGPVGFVAKFNLDGSSLLYSTYVEGHETAVTGLAVDASGNAYLTGSSTTEGAGLFAAFQGTPDAFPLPASTGNSAFLVKLNPSASVMNYATLLGGSSNDAATALALDADGNVYITGSALSADFPTTTGAYQTSSNAATPQISNAFIGKFALAGEANQTSYEVGLPSQKVPTSLTIDYAYWVPGFDWALAVGVTLNSGGPGPPPTGTVDLTVNGTIGCCEEPGIVTGTWTGTAGAEAWNYPQGNGSPGSPWEAIYSGDEIYASSSATGTACAEGVDVGCPFAVRSMPPRHATLKMKLNSSGAATASLKSAAWSASKGVGLGTKFAIPAAVGQPGDVRSAQSEAQAACIAPMPTLTIAVHSYSRRYGAANPTFNDTVTGLINGDTITVTPQTTATAVSPVGTYPITASVTGAAAANYNITVVSGTLTVTPAPLTVTLRSASRLYGAPNPALGYFTTGLVNGDTLAVIPSTTATASSPVGSYPITVTGPALSNYTLTVIPGTLYIRPATLHIVASNVASRYGQTPPQPTAYKLTGFVNGDTATIVSGTPILSTTVTATTPPGLYKIGIQTGTLTAPNYIFTGVSNGEGSVDVTRAPLQLKATSLTMTQGSAVPALTYTLTGFVNGQSAAGTVSGAPVLSTTATSASGPGHYTIKITPGTLTSTNYFFQTVNGIMTVTP